MSGDEGRANRGPVQERLGRAEVQMKYPLGISAVAGVSSEKTPAVAPLALARTPNGQVRDIISVSCLVLPRVAATIHCSAALSVAFKRRLKIQLAGSERFKVNMNSSVGGKRTSPSTRGAGGRGEWVGFTATQW